MGNTELNIDELQLDLKNPRFDGLDNQREALQKIVQSQGSKLVNLAEDKWKIDARFNAPDLIKRIHTIARVRSRIEFHQLDALAFIDSVAPKLPAKNLIYLDPPYYVKGSDLYLHHYQHDDHVKIAQRVARLRTKNWIVSYDNAPEIRPMYDKFRDIVYGLSYSAQDRYKGSEIMFFSNGLTIPEAVQPMHLAA